MIKIRELKNMTIPEITQKLKESKEELSNLEFQNATHQLDNTANIKIVRRSVARIKTVLREVELGKRTPVGIEQKSETE